MRTAIYGLCTRTTAVQSSGFECFKMATQDSIVLIHPSIKGTSTTPSMFGSFSLADAEVEGEWQWAGNSLGRKMAALEGALRCAVCSEYFSNPHSLSCGHSFCSECIRRHLDQTINPTTSGICPSCRAPAQVSHLRPEKTLFEIMEHFRAARSELLAAVADTPDSATINAEQGPGKRCRPGTAITRKIAQGLFHKQSKEIIKKAIEKLTEGAAAGCKLRTEGERDVLERRYKDFVHLHNAQLDSPNPLTLEQVVAEVHRRETARLVEAKRSGKMSTSVEKLKNGEITKEASDSFAELIKKAKQQKAMCAQPLDQITGTAEIGQQIDTANLSHDGDWKMVLSKTVGKVFYYNIRTKIGQFECPDEIHNLTNETLVTDQHNEILPEEVKAFGVEVPISYSSSPLAHSSQQIQIPNSGHQSGKTTTEGPDGVKCGDDEQLQRTLKRSLEEATGGVEFSSSAFSNDGDTGADGDDGHQFADLQAPDRQWTCLHCTYINESSSSNCDMCDAVKPRPRSSRLSEGGYQRSQALTASQVSFETPWSKNNKNTMGRSQISDVKKPRRSR